MLYSSYFIIFLYLKMVSINLQKMTCFIVVSCNMYVCLIIFIENFLFYTLISLSLLSCPNNTGVNSHVRCIRNEHYYYIIFTALPCILCNLCESCNIFIIYLYSSRFNHRSSIFQHMGLMILAA